MHLFEKNREDLKSLLRSYKIYKLSDLAVSVRIVDLSGRIKGVYKSASENT